MNRAFVIGAIVFLMLGLGFGSVFFPRTVTQTTTSVTTTTETRLTTLLVSYSYSTTVVTATVQEIVVDHVVATCTTISGTRSIVFVYIPLGETTTVTTIYPPNLPHFYQVTLSTATTASGSNQTIREVPDVCP